MKVSEAVEVAFKHEEEGRLDLSMILVLGIINHFLIQWPGLGETELTGFEFEVVTLSERSE